MKNFLQTTIEILNSDNLSTSSKALRISEQAVFYNQEFKHELISELFKGFVQHGNYSYSESIVYENGNFSIVFNKNYKNLMIIIIAGNTDGNKFLMPRTIDEFITDCQKAGIKLEWK